MRAAIDIAVKDLRQRIRDRSALMMVILAPLGLAFLFSTMIPAAERFHATYVVVDLDGGPVAQGLLEGPFRGLEDADVATIETVDSVEAARAAVEDGSADAAAVLPVGFSAAVESGQAATLEVFGAGDATIETEVLRSVLGAFASDVTAVQVAVVTVVDTSGEQHDPDEVAALAQAALAEPAAISLDETTTEDRVASSTTYYGASMAVLFVFFAAQFGVVGVLGERRTGTLARLLAAPVRPSTILLGKVLVSYVMAAVSMSIIVVATTLLLGASWGDPLAVTALIAATALAATGIATLAVGLARTEDQAGAAIGLVAMVLAILGGSFFPLSQAPEVLATISLLTPHAWFLQGIDDLAAGDGIRIVLPSLAVLTTIGLVSAGIGLARARRVVLG